MILYSTYSVHLTPDLHLDHYTVTLQLEPRSVRGQDDRTNIIEKNVIGVVFRLLYKLRLLHFLPLTPPAGLESGVSLEFLEFGVWSLEMKWSEHQRQHSSMSQYIYIKVLKKGAIVEVLLAPDLTWPDLTWPDLTWPDLTWPALLWLIQCYSITVVLQLTRQADSQDNIQCIQRIYFIIHDRSSVVVRFFAVTAIPIDVSYIEFFHWRLGRGWEHRGH